jgi:ABC-type lipoprotein release transport system permease subunit
VNVQLHKIIRDLWIYRMRTGLSIFAICVGLVAFGGIATALDALSESYEQVFRQSNPAQIAMQVTPFEASLLRRLESLDNVATVDARFTASNTRVKVGDEWISLVLHASEDYSAINLHRIFAEPTTIGYVPPRGMVWLDRSILQRNDLSVGDVLEVQIANGDQYELQLAGFVNDVIAFPSHLSDQAVAYVSTETLRDMKLAVFTRPNQATFNQIYLRSDYPSDAVVEIRGFVNAVQTEVESHGYRVISSEFLTDAPPLETQTNALNILLIIATILSFGVTGVMIANFVSAIVGRQINEIGIMKSLGAVPTQVIRLFFIMMIIMGLIGMVQNPRKLE